MPTNALLLIHRWNLRKTPLIKIHKKIQKNSAKLQLLQQKRTHPATIIYRRIRHVGLEALRKLKLLAKKKYKKFVNKKLIRRKRRHRERLFKGSLRQSTPHVKRIRKRSARKMKKLRKLFNITFNHGLIFKNTRKNSFFSFFRADKKIIYKRIFFKRRLLFYPKRFVTRSKIKRFKRTTYLLLTSKTIGALNYKGRQKTSPIAKEIFGKVAGETVIKHEKKYISIFFKKKIGRVYRLILKGLAQHPVVVNRITIKSTHPHGFIRPRKKRRK